MALAQIDTVRKVFDRVRDSASNGDGDLLTRYRTMRDQNAFGSLVRRHGPMVLGVCNRVLRDSHAADDAFQATFLVLAKKADTVRPPDRLAPWLYGVAYRTAMKSRSRAFRRQQVEQQYANEIAGRAPTGTNEDADLLPVIDEQLNALPEKYRTPLVLCAMQGLNKTEAAERLGLPEGTVSSRLARARAMLRERLTRRGFVVPAVALGAILTADTLQAAVPPALAAAGTEVAVGSALVPTTVLALSHEVLRSMILLKLKTLCAVALSVTLAGGGFGMYTLSAEDKKPVVQPVKPGEKPNPADPVKPGEKPVVKPDGEKPKPGPQFAGKVGSVDAKANTITLVLKGDAEKVIPVPAGVKVFIDNKEAKLADIPQGSLASFVATGGVKGVPAEVTEVRVTGSTGGGVIKQVDATTITLENEKNPRSLTITADTKVTVNGKDAKVADLKAGDKVALVASADEKTVLSIASGVKDSGKPTKTPTFGGKIASVDATAKTVTVSIGKNDAIEETVKLTADAKIVVDGKDVKIADLPKGMLATFTLVATKEGQPREATAVVVAGPTIDGAIKQVDATSITLTNVKAGDRTIKLLATTKVTINGKDAKVADLKAGDNVSVTIAADESGAVTISTGTKGDKPGEKPSKTSKFGGKIASVDATANTINIFVGKGEAIKEVPVKLTADVKITIDGKAAKIGDLVKGMNATFTIVAAKDGQPREASEVTVSGTNFTGVIKQLDATTITIGGEKNDRVVKLAQGGKVMVGEKEGKLADLKAGDKVTVTLSSDESAAVLIQSGGVKPTGDKPKPEKEEDS